MTSRNLKRFTASSVTAALVLAGMLVLGSETAEAQSERGLEEDMARAALRSATVRIRAWC